jgi:hypothetical protein
LKTTKAIAISRDCDAPIVGCPGKIPWDTDGIVRPQPELTGKDLATRVALIGNFGVH